MKEKNPTSTDLMSWNLHSKSDLAITFWAIFLGINFEHIFLIFYIWVCNTTIEGTMKEKNPI